MSMQPGSEFDIPHPDDNHNNLLEQHYQDIKDVLNQIGNAKPERYVAQVNQMLKAAKQLPIQLRDGSALGDHSEATILHFLGTNLSRLEPEHVTQLWCAMRSESSSRSSSPGSQDLSDSFERSSSDGEPSAQKPSGWKDGAKEWLNWGAEKAKSWLSWGKTTSPPATKDPTHLEDI